MNITLKGLITSFSKSIDLYNFLLKSHHRRTAIAAYRIGKSLGLSEDCLSDLVIAAALHDIGALTISERDQLIQMDVENPHPHSSMGCYMLESFEPFYKISRILYYHHWRYENDQVWVAEKGSVPIESYILHVADRTEILIDPTTSILMQKKNIMERIQSYSGGLFHPGVVKAFLEEAGQDSFWLDIDNLEMETILGVAISDSLEIEMTIDLLEQFAFTISKIIDSRSKFAISHSFGVSQVSYTISKLMGYPEEKARRMRVAGLLHDMGKIAISAELIEKKGSLDETERTNVRTHAYFTYLILKNIEGLEEIILWAAGHHENHDGSGYPMNLVAGQISEEMDIISYADIYTALSEDRPYRKGMKKEEIFQILHHEFSDKHGGVVLNVIKNNLFYIDEVCKAAVQEGIERFHNYEEISRKTECFFKM